MSTSRKLLYLFELARTPPLYQDYGTSTITTPSFDRSVSIFCIIFVLSFIKIAESSPTKTNICILLINKFTCVWEIFMFTCFSNVLLVTRCKRNSPRWRYILSWFQINSFRLIKSKMSSKKILCLFDENILKSEWVTSCRLVLVLIYIHYNSRF